MKRILILAMAALLALMTFYFDDGSPNKLSPQASPRQLAQPVQTAGIRDDVNPAAEDKRQEPDTNSAAQAQTAGESASPIEFVVPVMALATDVEASAPDAALALAEPATPVIPIPLRRPPTFAEVCETLAASATEHSVPAPFFIRLIWQESGFRHNVVSSAGAQGVAQFMPEVAAKMGLDDPFDPIKALPVSARLLHELKNRFGNIGLAAAAYNAGPKRVTDWLAKRGKLPKETQDYVKIITGKPADQWRNPNVALALPKLPKLAPCQREAGLRAADGPQSIPVPPSSPKAARAEKAVLVAAVTAKSISSKTSASKISAIKTAAGTTQVVSAKSKDAAKSRLRFAAKQKSGPAHFSSPRATRPLRLVAR